MNEPSETSSEPLSHSEANVRRRVNGKRGIRSTCARLTIDALDTLPPAFHFSGSEPTHWGVREVLWACWAAVVRHLHTGVMLPCDVMLGGGDVFVPVPSAAWDSLWSELGLDDPGVSERARYLLQRQLFQPHTRPEPASPRNCLPPHLLGMIVVTCWMDQENRDGRGTVLRFSPRVIGQVIRRHPTPDAFGTVDEFTVYRVLSNYLRIPRAGEHSTFRTLQLWVAELTAPQPLVTLSEGLFDEPPQPVPLPQPPVRPPEPTAILATLPQLLEVLLDVFDPVLWSPSPPVGSGTPDPNVVRQVTQAVSDLLQRPDVEVYGMPGEIVSLCLPQVGWKLDERLPAMNLADGPQPFRVNRRGLRVNGRVVLPALVAPQETVNE